MDIQSALSAQTILYVLSELGVLDLSKSKDHFVYSEFLTLDEMHSKVSTNYEPPILNDIKEADDFGMIEGKKWIGEMYLNPEYQYGRQLYLEEKKKK